MHRDLPRQGGRGGAMRGLRLRQGVMRLAGSGALGPGRLARRIAGRTGVAGTRVVDGGVVDRGVADHGVIDVGVTNRRDVDVAHRGVVLEVAGVPAPAHVAVTEVTVPVVDAAVVADVRAPVPDVIDVDTTGGCPVT